jgi:hypothetical protein
VLFQLEEKNILRVCWLPVDVNASWFLSRRVAYCELTFILTFSNFCPDTVQWRVLQRTDFIDKIGMLQRTHATTNE